MSLHGTALEFGEVVTNCNRLKGSSSESVTKCNRLKLEALNATGMEENKNAGQRGGGIAKKARLELEAKTGRPVITGANYLPKEKTKRLKG